MSGKPAARVGDPTDCPQSGHGVNPIVSGSPDVLFDGLPAARQGDPSACGGTMASNVIPNVLINGLPAVTVGTVGSHGNVVIGGSGTVIIGTTHTPAPFIPPTNLVISGQFDEQVRAVDAETGQPLPYLAYYIEGPNGSTYVGHTDAEGLCKRISTHQPEELIVWLGENAEQKMREA